MAKNGSIAEELKALGVELAGALKEMRASKEFKSLEKDIATSAKKISASLIKSVQAARKSESAGKIKKRVGRVVKIGAVKGEAEAHRARALAQKQLKKLNKSFWKLSQKLAP